MSERSLGVVMNGVTGRMGHRQHLLRSVLAIHAQGGVLLSDGTRVQIEPLLVGRNERKLRELAESTGVPRWTTDLTAALAEPDMEVYFDAQLTSVREEALTTAMHAGKHVYTEKPLADNLEAALELARVAQACGVKNGIVHDKLYLPGLLKLKRLIDGSFFGSILSVRGEFGYWVFEGDWQDAQRPSWNYRVEDGGGIVLDMFCHWSYLLENLFGSVESVIAKAVTHIPRRWDEGHSAYDANADDAAYAIFELAGGVIAQVNSSWCVRVHRDELVEFQVDGTYGSAVAGLHRCVTQHRANTPRPTWNPDVAATDAFREQWQEVPANSPAENGFKLQWEQFVRHVVEGAPHPYDFAAGARGVRLAEAALLSSAEGRRVELAGFRSVTPSVRLPQANGTCREHQLREPVVYQLPVTPIASRRAFAASHVVGNSFAENVPGAPAVLDWDATLAFRHYLWSYGLGVAEAMDTAQRGMGLDWPTTRELIARSAAEARSVGGRIAAGAGTDHARMDLADLSDVIEAYEVQVEEVEKSGAQVILMASRQLAAIADGPDDYATVCGRVLSQLSQPAILHWLGPAFDPALAGYWGSADVVQATAHFVALVTEHRAAIDGVKVSLLDMDHELALRAALPPDVRIYTGDDFNYVDLIRGDGTDGSDALLGIFSAIAPAASAALQALDRSNIAGYDAALQPTVALSRHLFSAPTFYYKTGIAFISWLSGHQNGFTMVAGLQSARSAVHLAEAFRLADNAGLFPDPELAADRLSSFLVVAGVVG